MTAILLHGWLAKVFIVLLWSLALVFRLTMNDDTREDILFTLITFSNFLFYLMVATRLPLLTHSKMSILLPDFSHKLKQNLQVLFIISLLPTLLILPDVVTWLAFISISMLATFVFVAMIYQPKYQIFIWLFILIPLLLALFDIPFNKGKLFYALAWLLPLIGGWGYLLLNKLVNYRGNQHHVSKILAMMNVSMGQTLAVQESIPFNERTKVSQWWANSNFDYYRKLINKQGKATALSNRQLIAISCQSVNSFGLNAYILWSVGIALICILGLVIDESYRQFFTPLVTLIPVMIIGTGSITLFQIVQNKKSYLARLAILPRFSSEKVFSRALLAYVISNQVLLYGFIAVLLAVTAKVFGHMNFKVYINLISILLVFCLLTISIMLMAWRAEKDHSNIVVWIMLIAFIGTIIFATHMASSNMTPLVFNGVFQALLAVSVLMISINSYRYLKKSS
ncbi:hypothetical protein [Colwellia piezophila]|uniref:hypothetical protein n=1 Tax=Colwellia piezophila TaxID=211668 RepID=UPI000370B3C6|nr:hypothetical protein [Colwellia piezophila]